jgi:hypothetical protein
MAKTWKLETDTKGTGARVVPLGEEKGREREPAEVWVPVKPRERAPEPPKSRPPRRFKVVDVMTLRVLADDVTARQAVEALRDVRSMVDVRVSMWDEDARRWRVLAPSELRTLWDARSRLP